MAQPEFWARLTLNQGNALPVIGLSTRTLRNEEDMKTALNEALSLGCRQFEINPLSNDGHFGRALTSLLPKFDLQRDDIFIVGNSSSSQVGNIKKIKDLMDSTLHNLGTDYLDLFTVKYSEAAFAEPLKSKHHTVHNHIWTALTAVCDEGLVNSLGVTNFSGIQLTNIIRENPSMVPSVNQIEWQSMSKCKDLVERCLSDDIVVQGYLSCGNDDQRAALLKNKTVVNIAHDLSVTPSQVLAVWWLENNTAILTTPTSIKDIRENCQLEFHLTNAQRNALNRIKT